MSVAFRADAEPVPSRVDYWQHVLGDTVCPLELRIPGGPDFRDELLVGDAGPVHVAELTVRTPGEAVRTTSHIRRSDPGLCKIDVVVDGHVAIEQDGRDAHPRPGDFAFVDLARPCRWINPSARMVAVTFPRALLPLCEDELARLTAVRIRGSDGAGALVSSLARQLPRNLDGVPERARLGTAVLDLLSVALAAQLDRVPAVPPETRQRALLMRIHAYIEQHLGDPELTPGRIAAAHYISIRYLHKLFATQEASVAEVIRRRRLERCRRDLLDPALRGRPVSTIAARWGLPRAAHFSRLFRAAYGLPPGEYRLLSERGTSPDAAA